MKNDQSQESNDDLDEIESVSSFKPTILYENITATKDRHFYEVLVEILGQIIAGETVEAVDATESLFRQNPKSAELYFAFGLASWSQQDFGSAIKMILVAHEIDPECRDYVDALATINTQAGKLTDGLYYAKLATTLEPHLFIHPLLPPILSNYFSALNSVSASRHYINGLIQYNERRFSNAALELEAELSINKNHLDCLILYGKCLNELGRYDEAISILKVAISQNKSAAEPLIVAGQSLYHLGLHQEAANTHITALTLSTTIENCAAAMNGTQYLGKKFIDEKVKIRTMLDACFDDIEVYSAVKPRGEKARPDAIHIGYIVNTIYNGEHYPFFEPIFRHHDKSKFKIIVYKTSVAEDTLYTQIKNSVDLVRPVFDIDPETLSTIIRNDKIDILVDLCGYSDGSQITILKQGIAPVQIGHLGFPFGVGSPGTNFVVSDQVTASNDISHIQKDCDSVVMDGSLVSLDPIINFPSVVQSPALTNGHITLGVYCDLAILTPEVASTWIQILHKIPTARLLLGGAPNICDLVREVAMGIFNENSISNRIDFLDSDTGRNEVDVVFYNNIDIFLDSSHGSNSRTVIESLWMGAPVVTMVGSDRSSLVTASILTAAEKMEWVAASATDYIELVKELSSDINALDDIRQNLKTQLIKTDLFNTAKNTKNWEAALIACLEKAHSKTKSI